MKVKSLTIKNIGKIKDLVIQFDKPLYLFFGDPEMGKTTILEAVKLALGGKYNADLITHGESKAFVKLEFDNGSSSREFYKDKNGILKAKKVEFIDSDGVEDNKPSVAIEKLLNPFVLDQNFLISKSELDQKKYFADFFNIETKEDDKKIKEFEEDNKTLRTEIKAIGDVDVTPVTEPDVDSLKLELEDVKKFNKESKRIFDFDFDQAENFNKKSKKRELDIETAKDKLKEINQWLIDNPTIEKEIFPLESSYDTKSTEELEEKISNAKADEILYQNYQNNLLKHTEKDEKEITLKDNTEKLTYLRNQKIKKLKEISESSGIEGLTFDEFGNFSYKGGKAGLISTSQMMELSTQLSSRYPEGFGINLIDRGESIGKKNISKYVQNAKNKGLTTLMTWVGDAEAKSDDDIGVFVVENGEFKDD